MNYLIVILLPKFPLIKYTDILQCNSSNYHYSLNIPFLLFFSFIMIIIQYMERKKLSITVFLIFHKNDSYCTFNFKEIYKRNLPSSRNVKNNSHWVDER